MIYLASYPKSGSTWVRILLSAYKHGYVDLNNLSGISDRKECHYQLVSPKPLDKCSDVEITWLRPAALMTLGSLSDDIVKTHGRQGIVAGIDLYPNLEKSVYIVRDPIAVVASCAHHFGRSIDEAIDRLNDKKWCLVDNLGLQITGSWSDHVKSWSGSLVIRYEDLLADTSKELIKIIDYLSGTVDTDKIKKAVELSKFEKVKAQEQQNGFIEAVEGREFFRQGDNSTKLTNEQNERIINHHEETMRHFNYI